MWLRPFTFAAQWALGLRGAQVDRARVDAALTLEARAIVVQPAFAVVWIVTRVDITELGVLEIGPIASLRHRQLFAAAAYAFFEVAFEALATRLVVEPVFRAARHLDAVLRPANEFTRCELDFKGERAGEGNPVARWQPAGADMPIKGCKVFGRTYDHDGGAVVISTFAFEGASLGMTTSGLPVANPGENGTELDGATILDEHTLVVHRRNVETELARGFGIVCTKELDVRVRRRRLGGDNELDRHLDALLSAHAHVVGM